MWKWVGVGVEGIIGVPATDLTDEEFTMYSARVNAQHTADQRGALANSGLYEYVEDKKERPTKVEKEETESTTSADETNTAKVETKAKKDE